MLHATVSPPLLLFLAFLSAPPVPVGNGISGSAHDFSSEPWNPTGEICVTCHTPHVKDPVASTVGLLWNHSLSQANYTLYTSLSLPVAPDQPGSVSQMCLACHDGTVALDAFSAMAGSTLITGAALIGTDLRGTHPIGMRFTHNEGPTSCGRCHNTHGGAPNLLESPLPFYDGKVECASCHNPHDFTPLNPGGQSMLRLSINSSELCFHCHDK